MKIQSAWGIVYYIDPVSKEPKFLLIKRHSLSKKIERVAPKGKIEQWEKPEQAAIREIGEEAGLRSEDMKIKQKLGMLSLQLYNEDGKLGVDKDITYFLVQYVGNPDNVRVENGGGFIGSWKRATIQDVMGLVYYKDFRELFRRSVHLIGTIQISDNFIKNF